MADDRLEKLSEVEDSDTTLRDQEGTVELSASDIEAIDAVEALEKAAQSDEESDGESTQVIEKSQLEQEASADSASKRLRTPTPTDGADAMTCEHQVPEALLARLVPTGECEQQFVGKESDNIVETQKLQAIEGPRTQKMQAVGTQTPPENNLPEKTIDRSTDSGEWAELDDEGFYTFIARADDDGRVKLPKVVFEGREPGEGTMVFVRAKAL